MGKKKSGKVLLVAALLAWFDLWKSFSRGFCSCFVLIFIYFERNPREKYALGFANDHRGFELRNSMFKGCAYAKVPRYTRTRVLKSTQKNYNYR